MQPSSFLNINIVALRSLILRFLFTGQLYFSSARTQPAETSSTKVINIDDQYFYEGYNSDFGPLTLQFVHKFIQQVEALM